MTREEVHDLMENELRCVQRGNYCDRDCAKCPLVKEDKELIEAYGYVIKALEQEPKTGYLSIDDVMSVFNDFMCGEVDEDGTETFLEMLKDKAESENT